MMIKKLISSIFKILLLASFGLAQANAQTTTAGILPLAKTQFLDQNGNPLTSGKVYFYEPSTTTAKTTWQDVNKAVANTNPVVLDAGGRALIWGNGTYRQQVYDRNNNLVWDQVTAGTGASSGGGIGDGLAVGSILPWAGLTAPTNYQFTYGQTISRITYADLLAALTITQNITCTGGSPTITAISDTSSLNVGAVLEANCISGSATVLSKTSSTVTLTANATINLTTPGTFYPYGNGDGATTFNIPDLRGRALIGRCNMGGVNCSILTAAFFDPGGNVNNTPSALNANGGSQSNTLLAANLPSHTHTSPTLTDPGHNHTYNNVANASVLSGGGSFATGTNNVANTSTSTTGITISANTGTNASGTSTAITNIMPASTTNYIIKVTPDTNISVATIGQLTPGIPNQLAGTNNSGVWGTITVPTGLSVASSALTFNIPALTPQISPSASNDYLIMYNAASGTTQRVAVGSIASAATSGVSSYNGLTGAVGGTNIQTNNYTIANTDCEKTVQLTSASLKTLTLPAVAGFPAFCKVKFKNGGARGVKLSGFPTGLTSPNMLWPLQSGEVQIVNGIWAVTVNPGRWKIPNNTITYADVNLGNDANDCLDPNTTDGACKTMTQILRTNDKDYFDRSGSSVFPISTLTVQLADNAVAGNCTALCYALVDIAYSPVGAEGRNSTLIKGNAATPTSVVISDSIAYGINVFRSSIEIQDLQFGQTSCAAVPKANSGISAIEGGVVLFQGTITFGCVNQQQILATSGGRIYANARPVNVVAGGGWLIYADDTGTTVNLQQSTVTFSNAPAYTGQTVAAFALANVQLGSVTWTNGGTVTTPGATNKWFCRGNSVIETDTGSGASIPGTTNGSTNNGCAVF